MRSNASRRTLFVWTITYLCTHPAAIEAESFHMKIGKSSSHGQVLVVQESLNRVLIFPKDNPGERAIVQVGEKPHEIEMSLDGKTAYVSNFGLLEANHKVGTPGTTISVIDVEQKRERTRFILPSGATAPHGLKIRPQHATELFTNTEEGIEEMTVFDLRTGLVIRTFPLPHGVHNFIFSADGADCYAFTTVDSVIRLDPNDGRVLARATVPHVRGLAWTSDHSHLLVGSQGQVLLLDPQDLTVTRNFIGLPVGQTFYPASSPEGHTFFVPAVLDGVLLILDARTGKVCQRLATGSPLQAIFDGEYAWISNVKVPTSMLPPGATERPGGLVRLNLSNFSFTLIKDTQDANGIATTH
jgi:DNA-binding beta-propeller fold protein YncE